MIGLHDFAAFMRAWKSTAALTNNHPGRSGGTRR
jgi:hypothetical protein